MRKLSGRTAGGCVVLGKCLALQIKQESVLVKTNRRNFSGIGIGMDRLMTSGEKDKAH